MIRLIFESFGIFVLTAIVLLFAYFIVNVNSHKATGIGWIHMRGVVLMGVGVLYIVAGFLLTRWHA